MLEFIFRPLGRIQLGYCFSHVAGGLFCFPMRDLDLKEYEGKMLELERARKWQPLIKQKLPFFDNEELPRETNAFIFKVQKH